MRIAFQRRFGLKRFQAIRQPLAVEEDDIRSNQRGDRLQQG
jgi:hypothetical protein